MTPRLRPVGERGFLVSFPEAVDPAVSARVRALGRAAGARPDVAETVDGFCSLLIVLRDSVDRSRFVREIRDVLAARAAPPPPGRTVAVPVVYGGASGPDLSAVAHHARLRPDEVGALHAGVEYLVYMIGFAPGFPYLGTLPERLRLPRRVTPRPRVPAGSVAIADRLTGIYPHETPGGWHLIGWTPLRLFDATTVPPALLAPGDRVRFVAADALPPAPAAGETSPEAPVRPVLAVRTAGLLSTVQDGGRRGYRRLGVPWSGPMDPRSHGLANARVGNSAGAASVEMTWPAAAFEAVDDVACALAGPQWEAVVDGRSVDIEGPIILHRGQHLEFRRRGAAMWAYLAVAGALDTPPVLGSRATYLRGGFGGVGGRALRAGDVLGQGEVAHRPRPRPSLEPSTEDPLMLRVVPGPGETCFTEEAFRRLFTEQFTVSTQIDRTGYRLRGPAVSPAVSADILPEGTLPGAIQVPGDGQPIVLMADGPTTGGYPVIATVLSEDLPRLAQTSPGGRVRFRPVTTTGLATPAGRAPGEEEA